ncbi:MAG: hypothetical protein ACLQU2_22535 [Candidatus Binataceae bacterium]|jgi:hypothetical protein
MQSNLPERPYTIKEAAALLGLPTWKLQRAVGKGLVPSYTFLNRRKLVRLTEIDAAFQREGGAPPAPTGSCPTTDDGGRSHE